MGIKLVQILKYYSILSLVLLVAFLGSAVTADDFHVINESAFIEGKTLTQPIKVYGSLSLEGIYAKDSIEVKGSLNCTHSTLSQTTIYGSAHIQNVKATGPVTVYGSASLNQTVIDGYDINVYGSMSLNNVDISGDVNVKGSLNAHQSRLKNISAESTQVTLSQVDARNVSFHSQSNNKTQKLFLKNGSHISEKIYFESGNGHVYVESGSTYVEVIGGQVHQ